MHLDTLNNVHADASRLCRCAPSNTIYCVCHAQGVKRLGRCAPASTIYCVCHAQGVKRLDRCAPANTIYCVCVPRTRRQWGDRAFSVSCLWNALPQHLTLPMTIAAFYYKLKTYLFLRTFCIAL